MVTTLTISASNQNFCLGFKDLQAPQIEQLIHYPNSYIQASKLSPCFSNYCHNTAQDVFFSLVGSGKYKYKKAEQSADILRSSVLEGNQHSSSTHREIRHLISLTAGNTDLLIGFSPCMCSCFNSLLCSKKGCIQNQSNCKSFSQHILIGQNEL